MSWLKFIMQVMQRFAVHSFSGRVSAVSISKDGKKLSFSANFDSPPGLAKFETSAEVELLRADDKPCIYRYKSKNSNDLIVVTGCENEIREMQIQHKNSAPFYGKIQRDGKVDEIELPPKVDEVVYPDDYEKDKKTSKTKSFRGLTDPAQFVHLPLCMDLELYLYYGPSFEQMAGGRANAEKKAWRIAAHAENHYLHPDFPTKINVTTELRRMDRDATDLNGYVKKCNWLPSASHLPFILAIASFWRLLKIMQNRKRNALIEFELNLYSARNQGSIAISYIKANTKYLMVLSSVCADKGLDSWYFAHIIISV